MMQKDDEVGKIAQGAAVSVGKAAELFMQHLLKQLNQVAKDRDTRTITPAHLKECVKTNQMFDFLADIVAKAPDLPPPGQESKPKTGAAAAKESRAKRPRKARSEDDQASKPSKAEAVDDSDSDGDDWEADSDDEDQKPRKRRPSKPATVHGQKGKTAAAPAPPSSSSSSSLASSSSSSDAAPVAPFAFVNFQSSSSSAPVLGTPAPLVSPTVAMPRAPVPTASTNKQPKEEDEDYDS
ncbi:hypothetical protein CAOG_004070 [Capsaspora owczarzaki ATCC 30864]|uniref:Transcription factor CBF/NF-Y/archaeal histone domain-containing protein n=2 Tax=Capsaspora owczarzaki (strain ATCC 30864) TaxID=595528 RepID=A0A0D2WQL4_CAPO3|nr:hypothetical protein CAOG_004070 [Capsaspora owczarzaki ATCC 30864]